MSDVLEKLKRGNDAFVKRKAFLGALSAERMRENADGQKPYAVVVACSDSRVIPEAIFGAGIGNLFTVRVAGNVISGAVLGSVEYAVDHLGAETVIVLGHTRCGAVDATLHGESSGHIKILTESIRKAIGAEKDPLIATEKNAQRGADRINAAIPKAKAVAAVYDIVDGSVRFL
ncbi:MAG: carbonic anhydrase [Clostridia bacterium]|nr:carbonic anhydrase [Clostridia bacterium]